MNTYRLYLTGKLVISPEIASWVVTDHSYQEMEAALWAERRRQERTSWEPLRRPAAWCLKGEQATSEGDPDANEAGSPGAMAAPEASTIQGPATPLAGGGGPGREEGSTPGSQESSPVPEEGATEQFSEVIEVADPQTGWPDEAGIIWWYDRLKDTPLWQSSVIEVLPTQYGRYVLVVTPHDDPEHAWIWTTGRDVRQYIEELRAARQAGRRAIR